MLVTELQHCQNNKYISQTLTNTCFFLHFQCLFVVGQAPTSTRPFNPYICSGYLWEPLSQVPAPVMDNLFASQGYPLTRASAVSERRAIMHVLEFFQLGQSYSHCNMLGTDQLRDTRYDFLVCIWSYLFLASLSFLDAFKERATSLAASWSILSKYCFLLSPAILWNFGVTTK